MTRSRLLALLTVIVTIAIAIGGGAYFYSNSLQARLSKARAVFRQGDGKSAAMMLNGILRDHGDSWDARKLAAQIAVDGDDLAAATTHIDWLAERDTSLAAGYARQVAERQQAKSEIDEAEKWFARTVELDPHDNAAAEQLVAILTDGGRRWEAHPLLLRLIKSGDFQLTHLLLAARTEDMIVLPREYVAATFADRSQVVPLLGLARFGIATSGYETAEGLVQEVIERRPEILEARIRLCEILLAKRPLEFATAIPDLPDEAKSHPAYWTLLGKWYRRQNENRLAVASFREALKLDPNRAIAVFQISQLLAQLGDEKTAEPFRKRAALLVTLGKELAEFFNGGGSPERVHKASDLLKELGRYWESVAWAQHASQQGNEEWATTRLKELGPLLSDGLPMVAADHNLASMLSESDWPVPTDADFERVAGKGASVSPDQSSEKLTPISLTNVADTLGIDFHYFNGAVPNSEEHRMYEFTGGGVGVIDYDLDGLPDLYLPNGTKWPADVANTEYRDGFFRNRGSRFSDVAEIAGLVEAGFGQGVSVGDLNCDGFPDIYVANTGQNQLWLNNGDGTFADATESAGITTNLWTTSCLIADLNADGFPDIYDANFLSGDDVFERVCDESGRPRSCPPAEFPGERDCVLLSRGDGTFADVTESAGVVRPKSNSLGIIAADFDGSRKLNLFLANDSVPNFYYQNGSSPESIVFREEAVLAGLDVDYSGKAQACMGVGIADVDANGLLDLFITNFHNESNALYLQQAENLFSDECQPSNIRAISQKMLGFGTQFLDIDLNGQPDLVITNGHVDDFTHEGTEYQMRPQILRHNGSASVGFIEQTPEPASPYFSAKHLGRGLARLDYNRDGLDDFGISHLDSPFALIKNETVEHGSFLSIRLVATSTARDAIGTILRVTSAGGVRTHQLTAGDGYMASNERRLTIGLGDVQGDCTVEVDWMSAESEAFGSIKVNSRVVLIEGSGRSFEEPE